MLLACVAIMVAALANYSIRDQQYRVWQSFPEITQMDDMPLFSTADAPYFLYHAETLRQKTDQAGQPPTMAQHRELPLLSVLLAYMATDSIKAALVRAGHWLNPVLAFLTPVMIALTFGVVGYWFEGAVVALGGGLSFAYLSRSSAGRIDTDQLNLGFLPDVCLCLLGWYRTRTLGNDKRCGGDGGSRTSVLLVVSQARTNCHALGGFGHLAVVFSP
jgi:undecaprenyl-diphosphooligosaccharide--protein glycosyltransferase